MPLLYKEHEIGSRRVDFCIENTIPVELKTVTLLEDVHPAQTLNYLTAYDLQVGLPVNFGGTKLEFKGVFRK